MSSRYTSARRQRLLREVVVFQLKLIVDGFRDLLLVPVSLVAGLIDLIQGRSVHSGNFRDVLVWGRRSERWIDLFGLVSHKDVPGDEGRLDALVNQVEQGLKDQLNKGGITASAKHSIDQLLDRIQLGKSDQREDAQFSPEALAETATEFWAERYRSGNTAWDRAATSPAFERWQLDTELTAHKVLVPGCGLGWEVDALARAGAEVVAIDLVEQALEVLQQRLDEHGLEAELLLADVLDPELDLSVDAIYEQTCLCALEPGQRQAYEQQLHRWLRPEGRLYALFMQTDKPAGPPHDCPLDQMQVLFPEQRWEWPEQDPIRVDHPIGVHELGVILTKKGESESA